jgi:anaerobic nitric oxide reductase transcription regulator
VISRAALKSVSRGANRNDIVTLEPGMLDLDGLAVPAASALAPPGTLPSALFSTPASAAPATAIPLRDALARHRRETIEAALAAHEHNWARTARALGIDASNLHKLARRLGLKK